MTGSDDIADTPTDAQPAPEPRTARGPIPRVVVVGRPNVGKSTLFNALAGRRVAIEDPMAGVTRDRVSFVLDDEHRSIELIDTGGIGKVDLAALKSEVDEQIALALDIADLVLFVIDAKEGLTPLDLEIAQRLRRIDREVLLVANKVEAARDQAGVAEAWRLGFSEPFEVSAKERLGTGDLRDVLLDKLGDLAVVPFGPSNAVRLAIVGRMNVGKSTLVNALVGEDRVIVSEVAGTTRDAVDVPFSVAGRRFIAIDTAGIRKKSTISDSVEFYGQSRAQRAIRRADVVLLLLDATRDVGRIDRQIAGLVVEVGAPAILVVNKWDLAREKAGPGDYEAYLRSTLRGMAHAPIALISASERSNLEPTLELAADLHRQAGERVSTGELNRVLRRAYERRRPRPYRGRIGKIYFASQVGTHPPQIVVFVNEADLFEDSWRRFLVHQLHEELPFSEIPIQIRFQSRKPPES